MSFKAVNFNGPVPRHLISDRYHQSELILGLIKILRLINPELRNFALTAISPIPSFFRPKVFLIISTILNKSKELSIRDDLFSYQEMLHLSLMLPEFIIPAIIRKFTFRFFILWQRSSYSHFLSRYVHIIIG